MIGLLRCIANTRDSGMKVKTQYIAPLSFGWLCAAVCSIPGRSLSLLGPDRHKMA